MDFLDELQGAIGSAAAGAGDVLNEAGHRIRYGVSPGEKERMMAAGEIPGMPKALLPTGEENPEAVRYASSYLAARGGRPDLLTNAFNQFAYDDWFRKKEEAARIKASGEEGLHAGQRQRGFLGDLYQMMSGGTPVTPR
jgi:hypothetical protein